MAQLTLEDEGEEHGDNCGTAKHNGHNERSDCWPAPFENGHGQRECASRTERPRDEAPLQGDGLKLERSPNDLVTNQTAQYANNEVGHAN
ncbi:MAG: hypothetical protein R3C18_02040 [Planctomycetaceae bacterium]